MSAKTPVLRSEDIHAQLGDAWPAVLAQLGIADEFLRIKKAGPCPVCGGRDRYTFDNRTGRGDFLCRQHGAGSGFDLLMRVHSWTYAEARRRVLEAAGIRPESQQAIAQKPRSTLAAVPAMPPDRIRALARAGRPVAECRDAVAYLESRGLWPLPAGCTLKAHPAVEYWHEGQCTRYPGLIAEVRDVAGEPVTVHATYLKAAAKIPAPDARKLLSRCTGRRGCAVRLLPATDVLGVAEGIETALSAAALDGVPVWAALNAALLTKFQPPLTVKTLRIYADRDPAGLEAAARLIERLQGGSVRAELRLPTSPHKDFNDQLRARSGRSSL